MRRYKNFLVVLFALTLFSCKQAQKKETAEATTAIDRMWWKEAIVYQIYPRSCKDSDGDGIGEEMECNPI